MYPNLYYAFKDIFGISVPGLRFVNSFGFFLAIAFLVGAALLGAELKRKSKDGLLQPTEEEIRVGKGATPAELLLNFFIGFLFGYKILALFLLDSAGSTDPQAFIFSGQGSWPLGLGLGVLFAGLKWWDKRKHQLAKPETRKVRIWPQDRVGEITVLGLIFGVLGAKLFDIFENWADFQTRPLEYILSGGGLTFYGGLICATIAIVLFAKKYKIPVWHLADAIAPTLMIAYAIGRIGCQVAGDGDWGVYNTAFETSANGVLSPASPGSFDATVKSNAAFFANDQAEFGKIPQILFSKPSTLSFLPNWLFAYNYPNNVNKVGVPLVGCVEEHCNQLPAPTFPTPLYETISCFLLFLILWSVRKRIRPYGSLFALYLVLNGLERFFIEKIRVNNRLNFLGIDATQAEIIASFLMLTGLVLYVILRKKNSASRK